MKSLIGPVLLILIVGLGVIGYREFAAAGHGGSGSVADPAGWEIVFAEGRSRLLERETLRIIVISKTRLEWKNNGRGLETSGHSVGGRGKLYLIDEKGKLQESTALAFEEL